MHTAARVRPLLSSIDHYLGLFEERSPDPFAILRAIRDARGSVIDFSFEYANPAAIMSSSQGDLVGQNLLAAFPDSVRFPELFSRYVRILEDQGADEVEFENRDGPLEGWYRNLAVGLDRDHLALSWRDISTRKGFEQQLISIAREYRHRLKNAFTIMGALIKQTLKSAPSTEAFAELLYDRLHSMSVAQDLLVEEGGAAPLERIVARSLDPFKGPRLIITPGPDIQICSPSVVSLCLALNELATNALKFGGLSETGQVQLSWRILDGRVELLWKERAPRLVSPPEREGFGTRLIEDVGRRLPEGRVARRFEPEGLVAEISFRMSDGAEQIPGSVTNE